jgi:hypothetical protein
MPKRESSVSPYPLESLPAKQYPGVRGKVVDGPNTFFKQPKLLAHVENDWEWLV